VVITESEPLSTAAADPPLVYIFFFHSLTRAADAVASFHALPPQNLRPAAAAIRQQRFLKMLARKMEWELMFVGIITAVVFVDLDAATQCKKVD
jgi:hypothetical protein